MLLDSYHRLQRTLTTIEQEAAEEGMSAPSRDESPLQIVKGFSIRLRIINIFSLLFHFCKISYENILHGERALSHRVHKFLLC